MIRPRAERQGAAADTRAPAQGGHMIRRSPLARIALVVVALVAAPAVLWAQAPWVAPDAEKAKKNPVPAGAKAVADGKKSAQANCVTCHGASGKGDGAAAVALNPKPADWTSKRVQDMS